MKFLSKLGQVIQVGLQIVTGFGPLVTALTPTKKDDAIVAQVADTMSQVAGIVAMVEAVGQAATTPMPGPEKMRVAAPLIAQVIMASSMLAQHKIHNEALFRAGCERVGGGMADILNSLKDDIKTTDKG